MSFKEYLKESQSTSDEDLKKLAVILISQYISMTSELKYQEIKNHLQDYIDPDKGIFFTANDMYRFEEILTDLIDKINDKIQEMGIV